LAEVDAETHAERVEILRDRGVPEAFVEDLATRKESWLGFAGGAVWLVPFGLIGWGWFTALSFMLAWPWQGVAAAAAQQGAWLYGGVGALYWVGFLATLIAVILSVGWLWALSCMLAPAHPGASVAATQLRDSITQTQGAAFAEWLYRRSVRAARDAATPQAFLRAFGLHQAKMWGGALLATALVSAGGMWLGAQSYWLAGPDGVTRKGLLGSQIVAWKDATSGRTGCEPDDPNGLLVYDVNFPAFSVDMGNSGSTVEGIGRGERIARLERVSAALRAAGVRSRHDRATAACVAFWAGEAGEDGDARLARLLRAP
jgi:hypothetical protein